MIIDINACLGHYPFRRLRFNTAATMLELMDRNGIDRAVVSSLNALFYRDAHQGNEELWEETKAHGARFVPIAMVNPKYVAWERDLAESIERWKMKAVTLAPEHHGYALSDEHGRAALARIAQYGVPVMLMQRYEDRRQRHHWDRAEDLQANALLEAARAHPGLKFLLVNWLGLDGAKLVQAGLKGRCLIDIARTQIVYRKDVPRLIESLGVEAMAFGSHMPFEYVGPSLVKLANVEKLQPAEYEAIAWRNAAKFLGLE
jgi:predicted TIM-barrel fold metal-dependent hydrolase